VGEQEFEAGTSRPAWGGIKVRACAAGGGIPSPAPFFIGFEGGGEGPGLHSLFPPT